MCRCAVLSSLKFSNDSVASSLAIWPFGCSPFCRTWWGLGRYLALCICYQGLHSKGLNPTLHVMRVFIRNAEDWSSSGAELSPWSIAAVARWTKYHLSDCILVLDIFRPISFILSILPVCRRYILVCLHMLTYCYYAYIHLVVCNCCWKLVRLQFTTDCSCTQFLKMHALTSLTSWQMQLWKLWTSTSSNLVKCVWKQNRRQRNSLTWEWHLDVEILLSLARWV